MYKDKYLFDRMNETFLNSTEEVVGCLFLGGIIFSVYAYAIFLLLCNLWLTKWIT